MHTDFSETKLNKNQINIFSDYFEIIEKVKASINNFENQVEKLNNETKTKAVDSIVNYFDVITEVAVAVRLTFDVNKISVAEFISYKKQAIKRNEQK